MLKTLIKNSYPKKEPPSYILNDSEKTLKFYLNQLEKLNKQSLGPFVTTLKDTLVIKLVNFSGKSVAMQLRVPNLCELPGLMTNFNQLVMQEFEILKLYVCFDMPLTSLNRVQAESINDLDNYLMATSLQGSIQKSSHAMTDSKAS